MPVYRTSNAGDVAVRSGTIGNSTIPLNGAGYVSWSGASTSRQNVIGLAAYAAALRLIAMTIASFELCVYQGKGSMKRDADDSPAAELLANPSPGIVDGYSWLHDLAFSVENDGNWFGLKRKDARGRLVGIDPVNPDIVQVRQDRTGVKVFDINDGTRWRTLTSADVLHVRGFAHTGFASGFSAMRLWANELGNALALSEFQGTFFRNNAAPGVVIEMPGKPDREQAKLFLEQWKSDHSGLPNANKPGIVWNGAKVTSIPVNLTDAQFIEAQRFSVEQIARITGVPAAMLDANSGKPVTTTEQDSLRFMTFCVMPRARRILSALYADSDLFPDKSFYPEFEYDAMLAVDAATQAQVDKEYVQAGIYLVDEIRARRGNAPLPPVPADWTQQPGMVPQITPVGGAPNPTAGTSSAPVQPLDDDAGEAYISAERALPSSVEEREQARARMFGALADGLRAAMEPVPVTVNVPAPVVNVTVPEQPAPVVNVTVPEQPAPVVNVPAAQVTVNVPKQPAPVVNVTLPEEKPKTHVVKVKRDPNTGLITSAEVTE